MLAISYFTPFYYDGSSMYSPYTPDKMDRAAFKIVAANLAARS